LLIQQRFTNVSAVLRRALLIIVVVLITPGVSSANPAAIGADPALFIANLDRQLRLAGSCSSPEQRLLQFHELFRVDFDVPGLGRFVLGRFLRALTLPEQQEFLGLFENYVVLTYSTRLLEYTDGGGGLRVLSSRPEPDGVIVSTQIIHDPATWPTHGPAINPIRIDWRVSAQDGIFKISDVIIDGLSMAANGRSQLEGVVERNGGRPQVILPVMRQQIADLSAR
jgi:phospholipid transport system substrate-binding protein